MPTPRITQRRAPKVPRIPSDEEMKRMRALLDYGRAAANAAKVGLVRLPAGVRMRRPAPETDRKEQDLLMERFDRVLEERVKARFRRLGIPYTDDRPYRHWSERERREAEQRTAAREAAETARDAFDPGI